jgi:hypothetical protein
VHLESIREKGKGIKVEILAVKRRPLFFANSIKLKYIPDYSIVLLLFSFLLRRKKKKVTKKEKPLFSLRGGQATLEGFI